MIKSLLFIIFTLLDLQFYAFTVTFYFPFIQDLTDSDSDLWHFWKIIAQQTECFMITAK